MDNARLPDRTVPYGVQNRSHRIGRDRNPLFQIARLSASRLRKVNKEHRLTDLPCRARDSYSGRMQHKTLLSSPDRTAELARGLGSVLGAGDTILLSGDVGAGKTHFARALIQSLLSAPEDVPSPTFTLVQVYDAASGCEIWHADLYRLSDPSETEELGLVDAMDTAICLIEWPDRLAALRPEDALDITLRATDVEDHRILTATWSDPRWDAKLDDWIK